MFVSVSVQGWELNRCVCVCGKASVFKACRSKLMAALQRFNILEVDGIKPGDAGD